MFFPSRPCSRNSTGVGLRLRDATLRLAQGTRADTWPALWLKRSDDGAVSPLAHLSAAYLPVATSHSLTVWSWLPEASVLPSGLYATERTQPVCPLRVACSSPVAASHSLTVWSSLPEASVLPSGLYATDRTQPVCPLRVARSLPVVTSHSLTVLSPLPEASVLPSGLYATENTQPVCPLRV